MARIGEMKCWNPRCSCADVAIHETSAKALSGKCHKCQAEYYGKEGTKAKRDILEIYTADADDTPAAPSKPAVKAPPAAPAPAPKRSSLLIG